MANFPERGVVHPSYWLALIESKNRPDSETLFIEGVIREIGNSFSGFRKNHSVEIKPPVGMMRLASLVSKATALALLMGLAFGPIRIFPDGFKEEPLPRAGTLTWEPATLPLKLSDSWVIDEAWITDNCETSGEWRGTGIPDLRIDREIGQYHEYGVNYFPDIPKSNNSEFARALCKVFGNTNQITP